MWGLTTHVSNQKSSTAWTTALKKKPETRGAAPSLLRMRVILLQTDLARDKFLTTSGQSSSAANITCPRYLKEVTISRESPYALIALVVTSLSSFNANNYLFRSAPRLNYAVRLCVPLRDFHSNSI